MTIADVIAAEAEAVANRAAQAKALDALMALSDEERLELFGWFCTSCGIANHDCQCWNDE